MRWCLKASGSRRPSENRNADRSKPAKAPAAKVAVILQASTHPGMSALTLKISSEYYIDNQPVRTTRQKIYPPDGKIPFLDSLLYRGTRCPSAWRSATPRPMSKSIVGDEMTRFIHNRLPQPFSRITPHSSRRPSSQIKVNQGSHIFFTLPQPFVAHTTCSPFHPGNPLLH